MTALTGDIAPLEHVGDTFELPMKTSEVFFVGSTVLQQSSDQKAEVGTTRVGAVCRGVCIVSVTEGDLTTPPTVRVKRGIFARRNSAGDAIPAAHPLGSTVYVEDDQTVAATATGKTAAGEFYGFTASGDALVQMGEY